MVFSGLGTQLYIDTKRITCSFRKERFVPVAIKETNTVNRSGLDGFCIAHSFHDTFS